MISLFSRIFAAARSRLEVLIPSVPGGNNGSRYARRRRRDERSRSSATSTPLSTPISMYSALSPGDHQAAALLAMSDPAAMPVALSPLMPPPQLVVVALDATRDHREVEVRMALRALVARGDILRGGDSLIVLGVLHAVTNPSEGQAPFLGLSFPFGLRYLQPFCLT